MSEKDQSGRHQIDNLRKIYPSVRARTAFVVVSLLIFIHYFATILYPFLLSWDPRAWLCTRSLSFEDRARKILKAYPLIGVLFRHA